MTTPGYPGRPLPPPRQRARSQPDAEVPEAVFTALLDVRSALDGLAREVATHAAAAEIRFAAVEKIAKDAGAQSVERWTNLAKALVPAIALIVGGTVGGQKLLADKPQPAEIRAVRSSADLALDECRPLKPGSYERAECFERVSRGPGEPR